MAPTAAPWLRLRGVSGGAPKSYVSPDGSSYWDGQRWVPMQQPARLETQVAAEQASVASGSAGSQGVVGQRSPDGHWWWDGRVWQPVNVTTPAVPGQPSAMRATTPVGPAWMQQIGGAAGWSIGLGLVSIVTPLVSTFYFPILPVVGLINGIRAIQRGRMIGGIIGIVLNVLGGLMSLIASGLIGG